MFLDRQKIEEIVEESIRPYLFNTIKTYPKPYSRKQLYRKELAIRLCEEYDEDGFPCGEVRNKKEIEKDIRLAFKKLNKEEMQTLNCGTTICDSVIVIEGRKIISKTGKKRNAK